MQTKVFINLSDAPEASRDVRLSKTYPPGSEEAAEDGNQDQDDKHEAEPEEVKVQWREAQGASSKELGP